MKQKLGGWICKYAHTELKSMKAWLVYPKEQTHQDCCTGVYELDTGEMPPGRCTHLAAVREACGDSPQPAAGRHSIVPWHRTRQMWKAVHSC